MSPLFHKPKKSRCRVRMWCSTANASAWGLKRVVATKMATSAAKCTFAPSRSRTSRLAMVRWGAYRLHWITMLRPSGSWPSTSAPLSPLPPTGVPGCSRHGGITRRLLPRTRCRTSRRPQSASAVPLRSVPVASRRRPCCAAAGGFATAATPSSRFPQRQAGRRGTATTSAAAGIAGPARQALLLLLCSGQRVVCAPPCPCVWPPFLPLLHRPGWIPPCCAVWACRAGPLERSQAIGLNLSALSAGSADPLDGGSPAYRPSSASASCLFGLSTVRRRRRLLSHCPRRTESPSTSSICRWGTSR